MVEGEWMIKEQYDDGKKHVQVISLGGGTQSIALVLLAMEGKVNNVIPDFIIMADTGNEPDHVHWQVEKLNEYIKEKYGKEIHVVGEKNIYDDVMRATETGERVASLPYHTIDGTGKEFADGIGKRQCTNDYKIQVVNKKVRELLGYKSREKVKEIVHMWKGITTDEIQRVKPIFSPKYTVAEHPFVDVLDMDRSRCITTVERILGFTPKKSSCIICPFHDNTHWLEIKKEYPDEFEKACVFDEKIRNGLKYKHELYLHKSRKPLKEVDLQENQITLDEFINECEGFCGI